MSIMTTKRRFLWSPVLLCECVKCGKLLQSLICYMSNAGGKKGGEKKRKNKKDCENVKCKFLVVFKPTKPKPNQNANCCKVITKSRSRPVSFPAVAFSRSPKSFTRGTSTEVISHGSVVFFPPHSDAVSQYLFAPALQLHFSHLTDATRFSHLVTR